MKKVLKNCNILTATNVFIGDILLEEGIIKEVGTDISCDGCEVVNVNGKYVLPGGVDQHVHFSFEYNGSKVRGFETSNAAAIGGTATVIEFINQIKGKGLVESIEEYIKDQVEGIAMVDYSFHSVMTDPREEVIEEIPSLADKGYPTMKLFMAYKGMFFHSDDDAILKALLKGKKSGVTIMVHAENADMIDVLQKKLILEGKTGPYSHVLSRPPIVEAEATKRAIYLADLAEAPIYIVHVSSRDALEEIVNSYSKGSFVYGETCSHYLTLDESNLDKPDFEGAKYVCSPALRSKEHRDAMWEGIQKGWLNVVSSDHCGFDWKKQKHMGIDSFTNIPNGAPGLENRLAILWTYGVEQNKITKQKLVELFSTNPAKINGISHRKGDIAPGYDADLVVFDPSWEGIISNENSLQGVDYNPYEGMKQIGRVEKVFLRGNLIVDDAKYIGSQGDGELVKGKPYGMCYDEINIDVKLQNENAFA